MNAYNLVCTLIKIYITTTLTMFDLFWTLLLLGITLGIEKVNIVMKHLIPEKHFCAVLCDYLFLNVDHSTGAGWQRIDGINTQ